MKLIPTRGGSPRSVPLPGFGESAFRAELRPDGKTALLWGCLRGGPMTFYSLDLASGSFRALSPPQCDYFLGQKVVSPDGLWLAFHHQDGSSTDGSLVVYLMRSDGTDFHRAPPLKRDEAVVGWSADSRSLYVIKRTGLPVKVERMDITTGKRSLVLTLSPPTRQESPASGCSNSRRMHAAMPTTSPGNCRSST
jgi:Tol biopolymer transport system component